MKSALGAANAGKLQLTAYRTSDTMSCDSHDLYAFSEDFHLAQLELPVTDRGETIERRHVCRNWVAT